MSARRPPNPWSSPWLHLAGPLGKVGASFLIVSSFSALFAPIAFLVDAPSLLDPNAPASSFIALFADPSRLLAIGDFLALLGIIVLSAAMAIVILGLARGDKRVPVAAFLLGAVSLLCLVAWVPMMVYYQGTARGAITTLDAAAATGGWSLASLLLLVASLAYTGCALRVEGHVKPHKLSSLWWPVFGAVNLLGSVAIAGFFQGLAIGAEIFQSLSLGLVLKVTLIPMFGVLAYGDLKDRFPRWMDLHVMDPYRATTVLREPQEAMDYGAPTRSGGPDSWVTVTRKRRTADDPTMVRPRPPMG